MMYRPFRHILLAALAGFPALALAAHGTPLVWRGDIASSRALVKDVVHHWDHSGHPHITLQPFNTVSGIDAVAHGKADIGGSLRGPFDKRADERSLTFTPVAWDALVMVTSRSNPVNSITLKQLHDIYYGKIHNWRQVGGPDRPIDVYAVASPTDGVEFSLRQLLFGRGNQPVAAPRLYINVQQLEAGIALDPNGLGASTMSGAIGNRKLKMLAIDGVRPTPSNVADGSYPLYTPIYLVSNPDDPHAAEVKKFISYMHSAAAEKVMRRHDLLPYAQGKNLVASAQMRETRIAHEVGRMSHNGPTAAPGATYADQAASAPTSRRTLEARQRLQLKRQRAREEKKRQEAARKANSGG